MSKSANPTGSTKAKLKQIHTHIKTEEYERAIDLSKEVLRDEKGAGIGCYNALILAALSLSKLSPPKLPESEKAYRQAIVLNPDLPLAYQGLGKMLRENGEWEKVIKMEEEGVARGVDGQDAQATADHLQLLLDLRLIHGTDQDVDRILGLLLPASPIYGLLSGLDVAGPATTVPPVDNAQASSSSTGYTPFAVPDFPPAPTYAELPLATAIPVQDSVPALPTPLPSIPQLIHNQPTSYALLLTLALRAEHRERTSEEKEVEKRRKRLGAGGESAVRRAVGREWLPSSRAKVLWDEIESHPLAEDGVRRAAEGRTFRWWYRLMVCLSRTPSAEDLKNATHDPVSNRPDFPLDLFLPPPPPPHAISKQDARGKVLDLSRGMVLLSLSLDEAPYNTLLEWSDTGGLADYDPKLLHDYVEMFPLSAAGRMIGGYLRYFGIVDNTAQEDKDKRREERKRRKEEERRAKLKAKKEKSKVKKAAIVPVAPVAVAVNEDGEPDEAGPSTAATEETETYDFAAEEAARLAAAEAQAEAEIARREPFALLVDTLESLPRSVFAHKVVGEAYLREEDWGAVISTAEKGKDAVRALEIETGVKMPASRAVFDVLLGTALVHYYPPKHHSRALQLLEGVLALDPNAVPCIMGKGRILQHETKYDKARAEFQKIVDIESEARAGTEYIAGATELQAREEVAWCMVKAGQVEDGQSLLKTVAQSLEESGGKALDIARCWWRIGTAEWELSVSGREQAHEYWVQCLRAYPTYAPAFTSIGIWYLEQANPPEPDRASKCFQKAFELDATEAEAARRLAEGYAAETEWALVDQVAKRVMAGEGGLEGGVAGGEHAKVVQKFLPTNAWAWKAAGAVQMAYKKFNEASQSFQVALRAEEQDVSLWTRLGEAYAKSGRHVAALKALRQALRLDPDSWICHYHIGNVQREMGLYEEAIESYETIAAVRDEPGITFALGEAYLALGAQAEGSGLRQRGLQACLRALEKVGRIITIKAYRLSAWRLFGTTCVRTFSCMTTADNADAVRDVIEPTLRFLLNEDDTHVCDIAGVINLKSMMTSRWEATDVLKAGVCAMAYRANLLKFDTRIPEPPLYDLAVALYDLGSALSRDPTKEDQVQACTRSSVLAIKQALETDPAAPGLWSTFGTIAARGSKQLAQHAYVIALGLDPKNASTWCSFGFLALECNDLEVANKAFVRAQVLEPDNPLAWTGQALVAHAQYQPHKAELFFDQAVVLSGGSESSSALGLAHLTFQPFLLDSGAKTVTLHGPAFALERYCRANISRSSPLVLLSLMQERLGQVDAAIDSMALAVTELEEQYEREESTEVAERYAIATVNLGRLRLAQGQSEAALTVFEDCLGLIDDGSAVAENSRIGIARVQCQLGSAIAMVDLGQASAALDKFQVALSDAEKLPLVKLVKGVLKETIAVYIARTLWNDVAGGVATDDVRELAKSHLLESLSEDGNHSVRALATTLAVGISTSDEGVVEAVQSEFNDQTSSKPGGSAQDAMTEALALLALSRGDVDTARTLISNAVRLNPDNAQQWTDVVEILGEDVESWTVGAHIDPSRLSHLLDNFKEAAAKAGVRITADTSEEAEPATPPAEMASQAQAQKAIVLEPWERRHWEALALTRMT